MSAISVLKQFDIIFWDFDGVIKKSNQIKIDAFADVFSDSNNLENIIQHHIENQGLSRFEKIPLYLKMSNKTTSQKKIKEYLSLFSKNLIRSVVSSDWVEGVNVAINFLNDKKNIIVTGTPEDEIQVILKELKISQYFNEIYGAPKKKTKVIEECLLKKTSKRKAIMIGDSSEDLFAAKNNNIEFMLIRNEFNEHISEQQCDHVFTNFEE